MIIFRVSAERVHNAISHTLTMNCEGFQISKKQNFVLPSKKENVESQPTNANTLMVKAS